MDAFYISFITLSDYIDILKMQNQKLIIAYDIGSVDWIDISIYMLHYLGLYFYIGKVLYLLFKIWKDLDIFLIN